jgi:hypothetical protein
MELAQGCPIAGFGISGFEPSDCATWELDN